jgi:hypothetical protein
MKFRERARSVFNLFKRQPTHSIRSASNESNIPKSSVHRQRQAQHTRILKAGHDFFESEVGFNWLRILLYAVVFIFGIQAHVGSELISRFFEIILVSSCIGCSASTIRKMKSIIRQSIVDYDNDQWKKLKEAAGDLEVHLGADDTKIADQQCLILMELCSGVILTEKQAANRTFKTWWSHAGSIINQFKKVLSFSSDGANVLLNIGKRIKSICVMDLFHFQQDITRLFGSKLTMKIKSLSKQLKKYGHDSILPEETVTEKHAIRKNLGQAYKAKKVYKKALFSISITSHPLDGLKPMFSKELEEKLLDKHNQLSDIVKGCGLSDKYKLLNRSKKRIGSLVKLNDLWWEWVDASLACKTSDGLTQEWAKQVLLPYFYWKQQVDKTRKPNLKKYYLSQSTQAKNNLDSHELTKRLLSRDWEEWAKLMSQKYQRTTSAIEGRNARLSEHYFNLRGLLPEHLQPLTTIHNFWIKREDQTTAIERLFKVKPPDLFQWILEKVDYMPLPRKSVQQKLAA